MQELAKIVENQYLFIIFVFVFFLNAVTCIVVLYKFLTYSDGMSFREFFSYAFDKEIRMKDLIKKTSSENKSYIKVELMKIEDLIKKNQKILIKLKDEEDDKEK